MKYNWVPAIGEFEVKRDVINFIGSPINYTDNSGNAVTGATSGEILSDQTFNEGTISLEVEFEEVDDRSSGEIMFYYDASNGSYVSAGISSAGMYGIKSITKKPDNSLKMDYLKLGGIHSNLRKGIAYRIDLELRGALVKLWINGVRVCDYVLPFQFRQSNVGVFCMSQSKVIVRDFVVRSEKPKVFMIMPLSSKYDEVYEEIVKEVCTAKDYDLKVIKADEIYGPGVVLFDIASSINEAKIIIADITPSVNSDGDKAFNANVFYEVGYAHALNKPTILMAEKGTQLPFDLSSFRVLFYENSIAGKAKIQTGLKKTLDTVLTR